jgi:hypothetical protein
MVLASAQKIGCPAEEDVLPAEVDREATWPAILTDYEGYKKAVAEEGNQVTPPLWASYTAERGWSSGEPGKAYSEGKINEQLYDGIGSGVLMLVGLFFLVRTSRRTMKVDEEAYYAPAGQRVAFAGIRRIDMRKWETKGLAYLYYEDGANVKKLKVDGMVYGQFKAEDGAPAERLFTRILDNFSGELVELESDEDDESQDTEKERADGGEDQPVEAERKKESQE